MRKIKRGYIEKGRTDEDDYYYVGYRKPGSKYTTTIHPSEYKRCMMADVVEYHEHEGNCFHMTLGGQCTPSKTVRAASIVIDCDQARISLGMEIPEARGKFRL